MSKETKKSANKKTAAATPAAAQPASELAELTAAMNNLASALHETNRLIGAFAADERWESLPAIMMDLNKRLSTLATRL